MKRAFRSLAGGLALAAGLAATGAARAEQATFDFSIIGIRIGSVALQSSTSGPAYTAAANIDGAGILNLFASFFFHGTASGTVTKSGDVIPSRFKATSKSPRALRTTTIDWKNGVPTRVVVDPPRDNSADPDDQGGTLDPVSAGFRLLRDAPKAQVCNVQVDMFDGSRRSRLKVGKPTTNGSTVTCKGTYARLKGDALGTLDLNEFPFTLTFAVNGSGIAELQRIEAPTNYGTAVVARRG